LFPREEACVSPSVVHPFPFAALFVMLALACVLFIRGVPLRKPMRRADDLVSDDEKVAVGVAR
jgi:hypothetical protein